MNDGFPRIVPQRRSHDQNSLTKPFPKGSFAAPAIDPVESLPTLAAALALAHLPNSFDLTAVAAASSARGPSSLLYLLIN